MTTEALIEALKIPKDWCQLIGTKFGSRSEAKRALRWARENGYDSARIVEESC